MLTHRPYPVLCPPCGVVHRPPVRQAAELRPYYAAAASVLLEIATGAGPSFATADSGTGYKYNREDTQAGTTPVPIPTAAGTNYSWLKSLALVVVSSGTTSISNRRVQLSAAESAGLGIFFQGVSVYTQASSGSMPSSSASSGPATPAGYTRAVSGSATVFDSANTVATSVTGRNGNYLQTVAGVDSAAPGAGSGVALPDVRCLYDEALWVDKLDRDAIAWARDPLGTSARRDRHCRRRGRGERF